MESVLGEYNGRVGKMNESAFDLHRPTRARDGKANSVLVVCGQRRDIVGKVSTLD
jgi:hypothetical protein